MHHSMQIEKKLNSLTLNLEAIVYNLSIRSYKKDVMILLSTLTCKGPRMM